MTLDSIAPVRLAANRSVRLAGRFSLLVSGLGFGSLSLANAGVTNDKVFFLATAVLLVGLATGTTLIARADRLDMRGMQAGARLKTTGLVWVAAISVAWMVLWWLQILEAQ